MAGPAEPAAGGRGPGHERGRGVWGKTWAGHRAERGAVSSVGRKSGFLPLGRRRARERGKVRVMWCDLVTKKKSSLEHRFIRDAWAPPRILRPACAASHRPWPCLVPSAPGPTWSPPLLPPPSAPVLPVAAWRPVPGPAVRRSGARAQGWPSGGRDTRGCGDGVCESDLLRHGPAMRPRAPVAGVRPPQTSLCGRHGRRGGPGRRPAGPVWSQGRRWASGFRGRSRLSALCSCPQPLTAAGPRTCVLPALLQRNRSAVTSADRRPAGSRDRLRIQARPPGAFDRGPRASRAGPGTRWGSRGVSSGRPAGRVPSHPRQRPLRSAQPMLPLPPHLHPSGHRGPRPPRLCPWLEACPAGLLAREAQLGGVGRQERSGGSGRVSGALPAPLAALLDTEGPPALSPA